MNIVFDKHELKDAIKNKSAQMKINQGVDRTTNCFPTIFVLYEEREKREFKSINIQRVANHYNKNVILQDRKSVSYCFYYSISISLYKKINSMFQSIQI